MLLFAVVSLFQYINVYRTTIRGIFKFKFQFTTIYSSNSVFRVNGSIIYNPFCDYQNISDQCEKQVMHVNVSALLQEIVGLQYFC